MTPLQANCGWSLRGTAPTADGYGQNGSQEARRRGRIQCFRENYSTRAVANSPKDREQLAYLWNNWEGNNQHVAKRLDHTDTAQVKRFVRKALENVIAEDVYAERNAPREDTRFSNFVERAARLQLEKALLQEDMTAGKSKEWFRKVRDCKRLVSRASAERGRRKKDKEWTKLLDEIQLRTTRRTKQPAEKKTNAASV